MKKVLVTGSRGFIGKNLEAVLARRDDIQLLHFDSDDDLSSLRTLMPDVEIIFHLAGVNRPDDDSEFEKQNTGLTSAIVSLIEELGVRPKIIFASSTQATENNAYGISKKKAEDVLIDCCGRNNASACIFRLTNVFGKWCKPSYNSVVATFSHNIAREKEISISDPNKVLELIYIDDVIASFIETMEDDGVTGEVSFIETGPTNTITLGELANKIMDFHEVRRSLSIPDLQEDFMKNLYATYLSHLEKSNFSYMPDMKKDERGNLAELFKSNHFGQIFVSTTNPGVTRGNHYHDTKVEKFCVLKGEALIRLRHVLNEKIISHRVSGSEVEVVDIPPGYTHSIENLSDEEMVVLFWADQIFDSGNPDTYFCEV